MKEKYVYDIPYIIIPVGLYLYPKKFHAEIPILYL